MANYLLQTRFDDGTVDASIESERNIIELFASFLHGDENLMVFDADEFGQITPLRHVADANVAFNYHKFLNDKDEVVFDGYSDLRERWEQDYLSVKEQLIYRENTTSYGEPKAFIELPDDRTLEVVHEEHLLADAEMFYVWRVYCNDDPSSAASASSKSISRDTCKAMLDWAYRMCEI